jgi:hypothetical protein
MDTIPFPSRARQEVRENVSCHRPAVAIGESRLSARVPMQVAIILRATRLK